MGFFSESGSHLTVTNDQHSTRSKRNKQDTKPLETVSDCFMNITITDICLRLHWLIFCVTLANNKLNGKTKNSKGYWVNQLNENTMVMIDSR